MIKFLFKMFALGTVTFTFLFTGIYMAITAVVPSAAVPEKILNSVYPLAIENTKIRFSETFANVRDGVIKQKLVFSELEANAFIRQETAKRKNFPLKEPYIYFLEDSFRIRFDVAMDDAWQLLVNQLKGFDAGENIANVAASNKPSTRIAFTIDVGIDWKLDHPEFKLKSIYIGVLPVPFVSVLNNMLTMTNAKSDQAFNKILGVGQFYIREFKMTDKLLVCNIESKVTPEFVRKLNDTRIRKENPRVFTLFGKDYDKCKMACTPEDEKKITDYFSAVAAKGELSDKDMELAKKTMEEVSRNAPPGGAPRP